MLLVQAEFQPEHLGQLDANCEDEKLRAGSYVRVRVISRTDTSSATTFCHVTDRETLWAIYGRQSFITGDSSRRAVATWGRESMGFAWVSRRTIVPVDLL